MISILIQQFASDGKVRTLFVLILLDLVLGIVTSIKTGEFRLSYLASFLRDDVLGKLVPYFALWSAFNLAGDVEIPGLDLEVAGAAVFGIIALALVGSILGSLKELGLMSRLPDSIAGPEKEIILVDKKEIS